MQSLLIGLVILLVQQPAPGAPSPTPAPLPSVALPPELDRVLRDYERAWTGKDPAGLAALFSEDGFVLSSGSPPVRGRDAIRKKYANAGGALALRALAWATEGNVGYIIGGYGGVAGGPDSGKFILALKRDGSGRWLIAADIDNSNRPPEPRRTPTPMRPPG